MPKFHERLKLLRMEKDLSQQVLADQISLCLGGSKSCSKSSINMYERGEREPGLELLEAFADFFNVDMDYLLGKSDIPNKLLWLENINASIDLEKLKQDIANEDQAEKLIVAQYGKDVWDALCMYMQLDITDQGEIRGEMKQMLKSNKYSTNMEDSDPDIEMILRTVSIKDFNSQNSKIAAFGGYEKPVNSDEADRLAEIERLTMRIQELQDNQHK